MIPPAHPSPGCPHGGEATYRSHHATLSITSTTTAIVAPGSTIPPDPSERAEQWDLEEAAVDALETTHITAGDSE